MNLVDLDPTVYERAAASVLKSLSHKAQFITSDLQDAEPFCCWAICTAAQGFTVEVDTNEKHLTAFRKLFQPRVRVSHWWGRCITEHSQNERAIALLLMADIVRSEQPSTTVNQRQPRPTPHRCASAA